MGQAVMGPGLALYKVKGGAGLGKVRCVWYGKEEGHPGRENNRGLGLGIN